MSKLRERMIQDLRVRNYSIHTENAYVRYVRRNAEHFGKCPSRLTGDDARTFLVHLQENGASSGTIKNAGNALRCGRAMLADIDRWNLERKAAGAEPIEVSIGLAGEAK